MIKACTSYLVDPAESERHGGSFHRLYSAIERFLASHFGDPDQGVKLWRHVRRGRGPNIVVGDLNQKRKKVPL